MSATESQEPTMSDPDLTPQQPGVSANLDPGRLEQLRDLAPKKLIARLDELDDVELALLRTMEVQGKARPAVLKAIDTLAGSRAVDMQLDSPVEGQSQANIGNRTDYASMREADVDASKLRVPVLTQDGWVLPRPRAEG